jgi:hypothetical protein
MTLPATLLFMRSSEIRDALAQSLSLPAGTSVKALSVPDSWCEILSAVS